MRHYDYSFLRDIKIRADLMLVTNRIETLRANGRGRKKSDPDVFDALEAIARVLSVKGSNEIEGIVTTDKRIEEIVNGNSAPRNHNEMEIAGYRDVLDMIHREHGSMELNEDTIKNMHRTMMIHTPRGGGAYKKEDNLIINVDKQGVRTVRFRPAPAKETPEAMDQMILAYIDAKDDQSIDPMLLIPCFVLDLLCIHPFSDGNGRISRLLSLLLMYKSGIDVGKYISFEGQINMSKEKYYESLRASSEGWHTNSNDYIPFIENFILTLFSCYTELEKRFNVIEEKKVNKGNRVEATVLNSIRPISKKEIKEILPDVGVATIEAKLSELQKQGKIKKVGGFKDARYIRK